MKKREKTRQKAKALKAELEYECEDKKVSLLECARDHEQSVSRWFTDISIFGPIVLSLLYSFFPINYSAIIWWHLVIDFVSTATLIVSLSIAFSKLNIARTVVVDCETGKQQQQIQIGQLQEIIKTLEEDQSFYITATELIGKSMKDGRMDLQALAMTLIALIYHDLSKTTNGDNLTLNLYELRSGKIRMVNSTTRLQHCDRNSIDIPALYRAEDGVDIKERSIQDYYCIKCIRGKVKEKGGRFIVPDWITLVQVFKWDHWEDQEKDEIIKSKDHARCIELGFKYNQYFAFKIHRPDGTVGFFEIIANNNTTITSQKEFNHVTHRLKEKYLPVLSILWDISGVAAEKEQG